MSCRRAISQPENAIAQRAAPMMKDALVFIAHLRHMFGIEALQEPCRLLEMKLLIARHDAQKEFVARCAFETLYVKQRMMRLRQAIQRQHSENRERGRAKNSQFECHRNECWPAVERAYRDVHGIGRHIRPELEEKSCQASAQSADEREQRRQIMLPTQSQSVREPFQGKRHKSIDVLVARFTNFFRGVHQLFRRIEFAKQSVEMGMRQVHSSSSDVCATSSRISAMEIAGNPRTNRNNSETNRPSVPTNVLQSQNVGWYLPHALGMKSRVKLITPITNRSSHMPTLTTSDITKSTATFVRIF